MGFLVLRAARGPLESPFALRSLCGIGIVAVAGALAVIFLAPGVHADSLQLEPASFPKGIHGSATATDGLRIFVFGGIFSESVPPEDRIPGLPDQELKSEGLDTIWIYDPVAQNLSLAATRLPRTTTHMLGAVYGNDRFYVFAPYEDSENRAAIWEYDPANDTIRTMTAAGPYLGVQAAVWFGERAYLFTANDDNSTDNLDRIFRFDPVNDTIEVMNARVPDVSVGLAAAVHGDAIYLAGGVRQIPPSEDNLGFEILKEIHRFDPVTDGMELVNLTLPEAMAYHKMSSVAGRLYLFGGFPNFQSVPERFNYDIFELDPTGLRTHEMDVDLPRGPMVGMSEAIGTNAFYLGGLSYTDACVQLLPSAECEFDVSPDIFRFDPTGHVPLAYFLAPRTTTRIEDVRFVDRSSAHHGAIVSWQWDFGDGNASTARNPTHRYAQLGNMTVTLRVTDEYGVQASASRVIWVRNLDPYAEFTFSPYRPTRLDTVQFSDTSLDFDDALNRWEWSFGDGNTSTERNPTHRYENLGYYEVVMQTWDPQGANDTARLTVRVVNHAPTAAFIVTPTRVGLNETVRFDDASSDPDGAVVDHEWVFGDGTRGSGRTPVHKFSEIGSYTVNLTVQDDEYGVAWATHVVTVERHEVSFTLAPRVSTPGSAVQFTNTSPPVESGSFEWDFGDGNKSTSRDPTHAYAEEGLYFVTLQVTLEPGHAHSAQHPVQVSLGEGPNVALRVDVEPAHPTTADMVRFEGTVDDARQAKSWRWRFSDGTTSDDAVALHRFRNVGNSSVSVSAVLSDGETVRRVIVVEVVGSNTEPPTASFTWSRADASRSVLRFVDASSDPDGDVTSWHWRFGDGESFKATLPVSAAQLRPEHQYARPGTYQVELTVVDDHGVQSTVITPVQVSGQPPQASFSVQPELPVAGRTLTFRHAATDADGLLRQWLWDFGDGTASELAGPAHAYGSAGAYRVTLVVVDDDGFRATSTGTVAVAEAPVGSIAEGGGKKGFLPGAESPILSGALCVAGLLVAWRRRDEA